MTQDSDDAAIVRSIVELGHAFGLRVVAEGVEDPRTWRALDGLGCDMVQGWLVSRALDGDDLVPWLRRFNSLVADVASDDGRVHLALHRPGGGADAVVEGTDEPCWDGTGQVAGAATR
jgi:predicted signal transduction protein with EAL and GGDEF domain